MRSRIFRTLWTVQIIASLSVWMQIVGAQWLLVDEPDAETLVALVQTASTLPIMLLALPFGVLADLVDRRRLLIAAHATIAVLAGLLAASAVAGAASAPVLLSLLFLMNCGQALAAPTTQALQPELVPREQIPSVAALNSISLNVGRAVGPAIAGALVALSGPELVFSLNALSRGGIVLVLLAWRRPMTPRQVPRERLLAAMRSGGRFVRAAPSVRRIMVRTVLFAFPGAALWALLPVVAREQLAQGATGYGMMLGALGIGAVLGAVGLPRLEHVNATQRLALSSTLFGLATLVIAVVPNLAFALATLVAGGFAWMLSTSTLSSTMQLLLPAWVRARGLSMYLLVFMGGQAVGSIFWGFLAGSTGLLSALAVASGLLLISSLTTWWLPIRNDVSRLDLSPAAGWVEPQLALPPGLNDGPVVVMRSYDVPSDDVRDFVESMTLVGRARRRTGAVRWQLYRDIGHVDRYVEAFVVSSWAEHLHQMRTRQTAQDADRERALARFVCAGDTITHLVAVRR